MVPELTKEELYQLQPSAEKKREIFYISVFYGVLLLLGVPTFYYLTSNKPFFYLVPSSEIYSLNATANLTITISYSVIAFDEWTSVESLENCRTNIDTYLHETLTDGMLNFKFLSSARKADLKEIDALRNSHTLDGFERKLEESSKKESHAIKTYEIVVLPKDKNILKLFEGNEQLDVFVRSSSLKIYALIGCVDDFTNFSFSKLPLLFSETLLSMSDLNAHYVDSLNINSKSLLNPKQEKFKLFTFPSSLKYEINFVLAHANADNHMWDLYAGIKKYLEPMMNFLNLFVNVSTSSENLFYVDLEVEATKSRKDPTTNRFYYKKDDLPFLLNPIEFYLSNAILPVSQLYLVVYIPANETRPLSILDTANEKRFVQSFYVPKWGGFYIYNPIDNNSMVDLESILPIFAKQLRRHFGFERNVKSTSTIVFETFSSLQIREWELQNWLLRRTLNQLGISTSTMLALADLLNKVPTMTVERSFIDDIYSTIDKIEKSKEMLLSGQLLSAFYRSQAALDIAESTFYNPNLLELLHFPDDQKFGVYFPLYAPIFLSVLLALYKNVKEFYAFRLKQHQE